MTTNAIKSEYDGKGKTSIFPKHHFVRNWIFEEHEKQEASLAHHLAEVAEKNNLSANDLQHLFPAILRMMKSKSQWAE